MIVCVVCVCVAISHKHNHVHFCFSKYPFSSLFTSIATSITTFSKASGIRCHMDFCDFLNEFSLTHTDNLHVFTSTWFGGLWGCVCACVWVFSWRLRERILKWSIVGNGCINKNCWIESYLQPYCMIYVYPPTPCTHHSCYVLCSVPGSMKRSWTGFCQSILFQYSTRNRLFVAIFALNTTTDYRFPSSIVVIRSEMKK